MAELNFNTRIINYAKINNISEKEAAKVLEKEDKENGKKPAPQSIGKNDRAGSMGALEYSAMLSQVNISASTKDYDLGGITLKVDSTQTGSQFSYEIKGKKVIITAKKCTIDITSVADSEFEIELNGSWLTLNSNVKVKSIVSNALNTTINGSDEDDDITVTGMNSVVNAYGGNDKIKSIAMNTTIRGGDGNDTINSSGIKNNIFGNDGDDNIFASGMNIFVDAGAGNDAMKAQGASITMSSNSGQNDIHGAGADITATAGKGVSDVKLEGTRNDVVDATVNDNVTINNQAVQEADRDYGENGYNSKGYDKDGFNSDNVDAQGYDRDGFKAGYNRNGYDKDGYDRKGYDVDGFDSTGKTTTQTTNTTGSTTTTSTTQTTNTTSSTSTTATTQTTNTTGSTSTTSTTQTTNTTGSTSTTATTQTTSTTGSTSTTDTTGSTGTTASTSVTVLLSIEFPEIPEEKGSYENNTLILYDRQINDDGTTSKIWDIIYNDKTETRRITQTYSVTGELLNTVVEDMDENNGTLISSDFITTFDANNKIVRKDLSKFENLNDGFLTVTTGVDPDGIDIELEDIKIEKIPLATTAPAPDTKEIEITPMDTLCESMAKLPKTEDLNFTNYNMGDLLSALGQGKIHWALPNILFDIKGIWFCDIFDSSASLYLNSETMDIQTNDNGLITSIKFPNNLTYTLKYNDNNEITEVEVRDVSGNNYSKTKYIRDKKGIITNIELENQAGEIGTFVEKIEIDNKLNIKSLEVYNAIEDDYCHLILDENLQIAKLEGQDRDYKFVYDKTTKILTSSNNNSEYLNTREFLITEGTPFKTPDDEIEIIYQDSDEASSYIKYSIEAQDLNIEKHKITQLPEKWGEKPVESMTQEEMVQEISEYYDWKIANAITEFDKRAIENQKAEMVSYANKEILMNLRKIVAILDQSEATGNKSASAELDGAVGTYVSAPKDVRDTNDASKDIDKMTRNLRDKLTGSDKLKEFYNNNSSALDDYLSSGKVTKSGLDTINGKIDPSKQSISTGDCWLLSAINTFIDDGEGALNGIVEKVPEVAGGGCYVYFKPGTVEINCENPYGNYTKTINVPAEPYYVSLEELNSYEVEINGHKYGLSYGDLDVKAIEIAYYMLCLEQRWITPNEGQKIKTAMKLLYGNNVTMVGNIALGFIKDGMNSYVKWISSNPDNHPDANTKTLEWVDLNTIGSNCAAGTEFSDLNDSQYTMYIEMKRKMLVNAGYNKAEVEAAYDNIQQRYGASKDGSTVYIPDKTGRDVRIYGNHAYTVAGYTPGENGQSGWVKLINPHDNSVSFEISEVYFKLLFNDMAWAN